MQLATFRQVKDWVGPGFGQCDETKVGQAVNEIRRHFYNWYDEVHLFLDVTECFCVQRFCMDCNDCQSAYVGVTLPRECQNVEAIWWNDVPLPMKSTWREFQRGMSHECACGIEKVDMPGAFSTFADILPGTNHRLRIAATSPEDEGKTIVIRGKSAGGGELSEEVKLSTVARSTVEFFSSINARGGIVKDVTAGRVILMDGDGKMYGRYEPDETIPSYRRIKLNGLRPGCDVVNIRCARRYFPLYDDNDVAESDNQPAWDAMGRFLRSYRTTEKTNSVLKAEQGYLATARKMMVGDQARETGGGTAGQVVIRTPHFGGRNLNRIGRRSWR